MQFARISKFISMTNLINIFDMGGGMNLQKKKNNLFNKKRELWNIFKIMLDKYGIYDQLIMDEMIKVEKELNKVIKLEVKNDIILHRHKRKRVS